MASVCCGYQVFYQAEIISNNQDEPNTAADVNAAEDATSPEHVAAAPDMGTDLPNVGEPSAKKILIGSQRDEADPKLGTPQPIRGASLEAGNLGAAIQGVANPSAASESGAGVAPTTMEAAVESAVDAELEAALEGLQMDSLLDQQQPAGDLETDEKVRALVTRIHNDNVFFSLKGRYEGIASMRQFKTPPEEGAMLDVVVNGLKEDEGLYEVTIPGSSVSVADWS
ncbi:MAG: hypothetical protein P8J33_15095, partial [Pirellulaceae bacterium]|nr:hypothetical protein [Pirellulaceae bacterium]